MSTPFPFSVSGESKEVGIHSLPFTPYHTECHLDPSLTLNVKCPSDAGAILSVESMLKPLQASVIEENNVGYQLISVLRRRKTKLNKHKLKKRRRKMKGLLKRLGKIRNVQK
uniref:Ribosomal protein mS38 C-terminal domain-containing protein n=1 Tax=Arcella intermedia TaxID=1963864 RepID=A0A6B2LSN1_9EUKA